MAFSPLISQAVAQVGGDPWAVIGELSGFRHACPSSETTILDYPIIFRLNNPDVEALLRLPRGWSLPPVYLDLRLPRSAAFATATLTPGAFAKLVRDGHPDVAEWSLQLPAVPERPRPPAPTSRAKKPQHAANGAPLPTSASLFGVIDSGCPFAREDLRHPDGTPRVVALWDQDPKPMLSTPDAHGHVPTSEPPQMGYGGEVDSAQLNNWMALFQTRDGRVDEAACYRAAGYRLLDPSFQHGAAVLGLLAGRSTVVGRHPSDPGRPPQWNGTPSEPAARADIVFVQVPGSAVQDTSSASMQRNVLDGLRYIVDVALARRCRRLVVNLSDSTSRTAHDGKSILERAMRALVDDLAALDRRVEMRIVLAAANGFADMRHATLDLAANAGPSVVTMRLPPDNEAATSVTVAVPPNAPRLQMAWVPPGADPVQWMDIGAGDGGTVCQWPARAGATTFAWAASMPPAPGESRIVALSCAPTGSFDANAPIAPTGNWEVRLRHHPRATARPAATIDVWISRGKTNAGGLDRARQSRFVDIDGLYDPCRPRRHCEDDPRPPKSPIRRHGTLNAIATFLDPRIPVVGSKMIREDLPSLYSSESASGATRLPRHWRPTDFSRTLGGIRATGVLSGCIVRVEGTSFAAPQVARDLMNTGVASFQTPQRRRRPCRC